MQHTDTILCHGDPSGVIRTKASGGTGALTYALLPGDLPSAVADSGVFLNLTAGTYTVVISDANGCIKDTTINIGERPMLDVQIDVVHVIGTEPGSINLTATGGTPPYQYSIDNGANLQGSGLFEDLPVGTYDIYVEDANGCLFLDEVDIVVNELDVFKSQEDVSCFGLADGSFTLSALDGIAPYTMTGSFLADPLVSADGLFSFTGQPAGLYDLRIEDDEGRAYIDTIELVAPAEILVTSSVTDASCTAFTQDGAIDLDVSGGAGGFSYLWSNGAVTEDLSGIEAGHYEATITDANNCQTVYPVDVLGINGTTAYAGEDDIVCPGAEYQLFGSAGDSVRWSPAGYLDDPTVTDPMATIQEQTEFVLTVYDDGCMDADTVIIDIYERIGMDIYDPSGVVDIDTALFLLEGESYTMAATPGFESYQWIPGTGLSDPSAQSVVVTPETSILYNVFGTTVDGCIESDAVRVVFASRIAIFSGFTPNGDGINDNWVIQHAVEYGERIHVEVFNRWGERVFDSKGYGGSNIFDGTRNGKDLPVGAYYYIIEVGDGASEPYTGTVTLIR
jgi:gliding motility-associated-like protein